MHRREAIRVVSSLALALATAVMTGSCTTSPGGAESVGVAAEADHQVTAPRGDPRLDPGCAPGAVLSLHQASYPFHEQGTCATASVLSLDDAVNACAGKMVRYYGYSCDDHVDGTYSWTAYVGCCAAQAQCTHDAQCGSGHCADGVCCDTACQGTCVACTAAKKGNGADGACGPIAYRLDPDAECPTGGQIGYPFVCGNIGGCDGEGACRIQRAGMPCWATYCQLDKVVTPSCDGKGLCETSASVQRNVIRECAPYACDPNPTYTCFTACQGDAMCAPGFTCDLATHKCQCVNDGSCGSGHCVDGVCCDTACQGTCMACTAAKKGSGADGVCGPVAIDTDPDAECPSQLAVNECGNVGGCDGAGKCVKQSEGHVCDEGSLPTCNGDKLSTHGCDGLGRCAPREVDCAPYACDTKSHRCGETCATNDDCAPGHVCHNRRSCI